MTMSSVPPPSHTFNLMFCVYIYNRGFIPHNHVPDDIEIYQFRRVIFEGYAPEFTHSIFSTVPGIEHPVRVVIWPSTHKSRNAL